MNPHFPQKENYVKKPSSYAREEKDQHQYEIRISPGNSPEFNNPIISIKGISSCYHCQNNNIQYDTRRDEIYCYNCGTVLRQGLKDYTPSFGNFQTTNKGKIKKNTLK